MFGQVVAAAGFAALVSAGTWLVRGDTSGPRSRRAVRRIAAVVRRMLATDEAPEAWRAALAARRAEREAWQ